MLGSSGAYSHSKSDQTYKFEGKKKQKQKKKLLPEVLRNESCYSEFGKWKEVTISLEFHL